MLYPLPETLRRRLKKPLGRLIASDEINSGSIRDIVDDCKKIVTVGDATTEKLLSMNIVPMVQIVDGREMRAARRLPKKAHKTEIRVSNPAGNISQESIDALKEALKMEEPVRILVDGEEDLLTLVALSKYPMDSVILYGQPYEGIVAVKIDRETRRFAELTLEKMGIRDP